MQLRVNKITGLKIQALIVGLCLGAIIGCSPKKRTFLPMIYDIEILINEQHPRYKTEFIPSPDNQYLLVKYFKEPAMSFSTGTTCIGLYKGKYLIDEKHYSEDDYGAELTWLNSDTVEFYFYRFNWRRYEVGLKLAQLYSEGDKIGDKIIRIIYRTERNMVKKAFNNYAKTSFPIEIFVDKGGRSGIGVIPYELYIVDDPKYRNKLVKIEFFKNDQVKIYFDEKLIAKGSIKDLANDSHLPLQELIDTSEVKLYPYSRMWIDATVTSFDSTSGFILCKVFQTDSANGKELENLAKIRYYISDLEGENVNKIVPDSLQLKYFWVNEDQSKIFFTKLDKNNSGFYSKRSSKNIYLYDIGKSKFVKWR